MAPVILRVALVGMGGVGKTAMATRFVFEEYADEFDPTVGVDRSTKTFDVDETTVEMHFYDIAGLEEFRSKIMYNEAYKVADGVVFVYDVFDFESLKKIEQEFLSEAECAEKAIKFLVGNKADFEEETENQAVSFYTGKAFADKHNMGFLEASVKQNSNVTETFHTLARAILKQKEAAGELMIHAAKSGNFDKLKYYSQRSETVNVVAQHDGTSCLMEAALGGHDCCVQFLIDSGATIDQSRTDGMTALMLAAKAGHYWIVKMLVEQGAADVTMTDSNGKTAWDHAKDADHDKIIQMLTKMQVNYLETKKEEGFGRKSQRLSRKLDALEQPQEEVASGEAASEANATAPPPSGCCTIS